MAEGLQERGFEKKAIVKGRRVWPGWVEDKCPKNQLYIEVGKDGWIQR